MVLSASFYKSFHVFLGGHDSQGPVRLEALLRVMDTVFHHGKGDISFLYAPICI